jgi:hypothetical protein
MTARDQLRSIVATLADMAASHEIFLTGGPVNLRTTSTVAEPLTALAAAVAPYLRPAVPVPAVKSSGVCQQLDIHVDPVMAKHLRALADGPTGGIHLVRAWTQEREQFQEAFLLWDQVAPHRSYLVLDHLGPAADKITLRLVRGVASRCLIIAGWVPLHAAALVTRVGLIVLTGPSRAGKTTALMQLLNDRIGHAFVTNDKAYLAISGGSVYVRALPTSVALRADTATMFPVVAGVSPRESALSGSHHLAVSDRRLHVPARRIAGAFGADIHCGGTVASILAISYGGPGRLSSWRRAGPPSALTAISGGYLDDWFIDEPYEFARLGTPPARLRATHHTTLRRISLEVPVFELNAGVGTPQAMRGIVASLAETPSGGTRM